MNQTRMTEQQLQNRIAFYTHALHNSTITAREFNGFIEALAKIMTQD